MVWRPCSSRRAGPFTAAVAAVVIFQVCGMPAATRVISVLDRLKDWPSGRFIALREILDPEGYAQLYAGTRAPR